MSETPAPSAPPRRVVPFLWYDRDAEAAVAHYLRVVGDGRVLSVSRYGPGAPLPAGTAMTVEFELAGVRMTALNGGPIYQHTPAFSLMLPCETQEEVDRLWDGLCEGGEPGRCGWLKDRWGVSWQVVPRALGATIGGPDRAGAARALQAMFTMSKLDVAALERAYRGEG